MSVVAISMPLSRVPVGEFGPLTYVRGKATPEEVSKSGDNERLAGEVTAGS